MFSMSFNSTGIHKQHSNILTQLQYKSVTESNWITTSMIKNNMDTEHAGKNCYSNFIGLIWCNY